ncbi:MAG: sucrase ferredoxin [Dehalococcoidia bacterium]
MTGRIAADFLCSVAAADRAEDPIGSGLFTSRALALEVPAPWGDSFYRADPLGTIRQRTVAMLTDHYARLREDPPPGGPFADGYVSVFAVAPDPGHGVPGVSRALLLERAPGPFRSFEVSEYHFPLGSERQLDLVAALLDGRRDYSEVEAFRVPLGAEREFFVCTHGQVDICCGKFGFPLYAEARRLEGARVWRASHFGGHRYAPTAWEMPSGYMWGFLDAASTAAILARSGDPAAVRPKMRGASGLEVQLQLLDRAGFEEFGWPWLAFERSGSVEPVGPGVRRWRVALAYRTPGRQAGAFRGEVEVAGDLPVIGCGSGTVDATYTVPDYRLVSVTHDRDVAFPVLATF